uniref:Zinc finger, CCHC-type n=1 Tax=Tanacetum cinerariifolium TaxID=118510 RepID=A0A6L2JK28_TANCI|nr:zinc finger, CCHC-type [Tanacetum cinerariifolium]
MGDENPIHTLGDYSKPSHEGYMNTIKLLVGNNVVPFRSDTFWLVQNGCSFHRLRSKAPNQHLKDFLKLVDSLDLNGKYRERTRLRLFQFSLRDQASNWLEHLPACSITAWEDLTTRFLAQFFPPGKTVKLYNDIMITIDFTTGGQLRRMSAKRAWIAIEELAQYEDEGWNDLVNPEDGDLNYENPDIEKLLGIIEHKVNALMNNALSVIGKSQGMFEMKRNEMYRQLPESSRQAEFKNIVTNFIFHQEESIRRRLHASYCRRIHGVLFRSCRKTKEKDKGKQK